MGNALGMDARATGEHLLVSEAGGWTAFPRSRMLLPTLPYLPDGGPYPREDRGTRDGYPGWMANLSL
eukprot:11167208-Lingulodinium_polyedra.AAC.1